MPPEKPRVCEECEKVQKDVEAMEARVQALEIGTARMREAFIKNDLGVPDYDGHRVAHYNAVEQSKVVAGYKHDMTKRVLEWALVAVAVLIGQGALDWLKAHMK